ncbi:MAG: nucleotide-binding protein [Methylococcales symbiont of Hymedesmia sp. n. MRB-2018]|nr:MAG: nucleotide-binding protein [Methylococcales symbiont of Hymedesmia sp. n. MRB-2018]
MLVKDKSSFNKEKSLFYATKIEEFFKKYRPSGDGLYIPPSQTSHNDDNVKNIFTMAKEVSNLSDTDISVMLPGKKSSDDFLHVKNKLDTSKVFIVHGHEGETKNEVARLVEKLGFETVILHEQASAGMTIIEKIEKHSNVGFAIILYTPDDIGAASSDKENFKKRARQNVVFEHGYLIGKISRDRVATVVKGDIELPNDISGVVYVGESNWQIDLAKEMNEAGYDIDFNKLLK